MRLLVCAVSIAVALAAMPANAAVSGADLQVIARALAFMEKPMTGTVRLGIVYDPHEPQSAQGATDLVRMMGSGLAAGDLTFTPVLVGIDKIEIAQVDVFLLPEGLGARTFQVTETAEHKKIPCVTLDIAQVQNGSCVLGVSLQPKVQIYLSRKAAELTGTSFVSIFRMMVTEF